ncbi:MAG: sensor histidine kinase [Bacteroidota bacterium]
MGEIAFDREWRLDELLEAPLLQRVGPALAELLGGEAAILDAAGRACWGGVADGARREPLILELEAVGYLASTTASPAALHGGRDMLLAVLRAQVRFKMASTLHLEAVAEDFESLKREHARLLDSESRYRKLSGELEIRVRQQVAELEERQQMLYQAEKLASVGQLAAGMAHEINNPLGFIGSNLSTFKGYLETFAALKARLGEAEVAWRELDLDFILEDGVDLLADSAKGIERIARIVADLKSFSNVDRASEEYADLNDSLQHVANVMTSQLPAGIRIELELGELPRVICLPGHVNQLFFNIVRNAVQAIEDAGRPGIVRVSSGAVANGVEIRIADDGVGMTAEQRERVFEPFFTTRAVGAGAGLGLSTARNIVLAHSGRIDLASTPGVGTIVTLFFPTPK